ncbi:MAG: prolyl-tRNA synthetase associated domain-containing protein [Clostridia bacterium]|nr:prolyl-tRNA synthetase associated domain-containing protein [Clostridia bacterium]
MSFYIDPTLYEGAPQDRAARDEVEQGCYELLERLSIPFWRVDHDAADTIEDCKLVEDVIGVHICKNLFLQNRQGTDFYLLMMAGDKPFRTAEVSKLLGVSRLSFASPEKMLEMLGCTPGSVSILGLAHDKGRKIRLLVDEDIWNADYVRCHPLKNTSTLKIAASDVKERLLPFIGHKATVLRITGKNEG